MKVININRILFDDGRVYLGNHLEGQLGSVTRNRICWQNQNNHGGSWYRGWPGVFDLIEL